MAEAAPYTAPDIAILVAAYDVLDRRLVAADDAADVAYYGEYALAALRPVLWGLTGDNRYADSSDLEPPPRPCATKEPASNVVLMPFDVQAGAVARLARRIPLNSAALTAPDPIGEHAPRPSLDDEGVYRVFAATLADGIEGLIGKPLTESQEAELLQELRHNLGDEEMGERLERRWNLPPCSQLSTVLNTAPATLETVYTGLVKQWVAENGIKLSLPVDTIVSTPRGPGKIVKWDEATARYVVRTERDRMALGDCHVGIFYAPEQIAWRP